MILEGNQLINVDITTENNIIKEINRLSEGISVETFLKEKGINEDRSSPRIESTFNQDGNQITDLKNKLLTAPFVDLHVHTRQPGLSYKEDMDSFSKAAYYGGYTCVCAMPNANPVIDSCEALEKALAVIDTQNRVTILQTAAITSNLKGTQLTDMKALAEKGAFGFSNDGLGVENGETMEMAMKTAMDLNKMIFSHCEAFDQGSFNDWGGNRETEYKPLERDLEIAFELGYTGYHGCHLSARESIEIIKKYKDRGLKVTCEVSPHHLIYSEDTIDKRNSLFKVNPPIRWESDRRTLLEGLKTGVIDVIATDHAPHSKADKEKPISQAAFGIVGLETAFPLLFNHLVKAGELTLSCLLDAMSKKPMEILGLPQVRIEEGQKFNAIAIDLSNQKYYSNRSNYSKGYNSLEGFGPVIHRLEKR